VIVKVGRWNVLRAVVLAMWLVVAAAAWWSAPRPATYAPARTAVTDKQVTVYQWVPRT
jgi:hypothetical protein